ncbi:LD-carboxypeptidase [Hyphomonas sp. WL0036]|uniref:LD-carboxypeptidase n=1 Tax=Hyphomonas sediminis TaxID=2866160 RepID=UPI001C7E3077|nr:LD-carboxypeptidase [Hyphomonas sediminis]MBY9066979.1 LD-carboxypeptidase [Hyphomonas sediminis]
MIDRKISIGIVAPGRSLDKSIADRVTALSGNSAELFFHPQCFLREGHFAGPDEARVDAFVQFANDPGLDAIWFARGGYGACRLLDSAFERLGEAARRKTYLGYSDTGFLLARLAKEGIGRVAHGPMPADILREGGEAAVRRAIGFLSGADGEAGVEPGTRVPGKYAAYNISVLASLIGTDYAPDLSGATLLIEDVGEYHYRLDRLMFTLTSSETVRAAAGIRLGRCGPIPVNDVDFGQDEEEIARSWCARNGIAYLGRADIGHDVDNKIVVFGERSASV